MLLFCISFWHKYIHAMSALNVGAGEKLDPPMHEITNLNQALHDVSMCLTATLLAGLVGSNQAD